MTSHECLSGRDPRVVPEFVGQEWSCPDCGRQWVGTRVKYIDWPGGRVPDGVDPDMLGWRGAS